MMYAMNDEEFSFHPYYISLNKNVKFQNVKSEYQSNEDIVIEYVLDPDTLPSSRNWIGLYAKGSTNLEDYVTFEWTIDSHGDKESRHTVTFCAKYHAQYIKTNQEYYYFLFVNTRSKIVGESPFFQFIPDEKPDTNSVLYEVCHWVKDARNVKRRLVEDLSLTPLSSGGRPLARSVSSPLECGDSPLHCPRGCLLAGRSPLGGLSDGNGHSLRPAATSSPPPPPPPSEPPLALPSPDFPTSAKSSLSSSGDGKRPGNTNNLEQQLRTKIRLAAEYSRTLEKRVQELEKELEMSQVAQKQLKLSAHHAKREKGSYQKFVNEMLYAVSNKGAVRVLDGQGTELFLKRVTGSQLDDSTSSYKTSHRERLLRAVIESQENTIKDLLSKLETKQAIKIDGASVQVVDGCGKPRGSNNHPDEASRECFQNAMDEIPDSLVTIFPQQQAAKPSSPEEHKRENEDLINRVLNETYSVDKPISIVLPPDMSASPEPLKQVILEDDEEEKMVRSAASSATKVQQKGSTQASPAVAHGAGECQLRQHMMAELANVIRRRQEDSSAKMEKRAEPLESSLEQSKASDVRKEDTSPTALVIKGDHLQYAIIRIHQPPFWKD